MNFIIVSALGIGAMIGSGLFALLGHAILKAGILTPISFLVSGIAALFCGYSYTKLNAYLPKSGGIFLYYKTAFQNRVLSFFLTLLHLFCLMISCAFLVKTFSVYASSLLPVFLQSSLITTGIEVLLVLTIFLLNQQKEIVIGRVEVCFVFIQLLLIFVLMAFISAMLKPVDMTFLSMPKIDSFMGSFGVTFFAYSGFGMMVNAVTSAKKGATTITKAIYSAIVFVMVLYGVVGYVILNHIELSQPLTHTGTVMLHVAEKLWGSAGILLFSIMALTMFVSGLNALFYSCFKIVTTLVQEGFLPELFEKRLWGFSKIGQVLFALIIIISVNFLNFSTIVLFSSGGFLLSYLTIILACWCLRKETYSNPMLLIIGLVLMIFILLGFVIDLAIIG